MSDTPAGRPGGSRASARSARPRGSSSASRSSSPGARSRGPSGSRAPSARARRRCHGLGIGRRLRQVDAVLAARAGPAGGGRAGCGRRPGRRARRRRARTCRRAPLRAIRRRSPPASGAQVREARRGLHRLAHRELEPRRVVEVVRHRHVGSRRSAWKGSSGPVSRRASTAEPPKRKPEPRVDELGVVGRDEGGVLRVASVHPARGGRGVEVPHRLAVALDRLARNPDPHPGDVAGRPGALRSRSRDARRPPTRPRCSTPSRSPRPGPRARAGAARPRGGGRGGQRAKQPRRRRVCRQIGTISARLTPRRLAEMPKTLTGAELQLDDAPARESDLFLVDGNNLAYRAFFALPEELATSEGFSTNALLGFTNMLFKLLADYRPKGVAVAWDTRPVHRTELAPRRYKERAQADARPAARAVPALPADRRGLRLPQPRVRGLGGGRRDRHARARAPTRPGSRRASSRPTATRSSSSPRTSA